MPTTDERVLKFIGRDGTTEGDLDQHFPNFDVNRLIRAQLVAIATEQDADTASCLSAAVSGLDDDVLSWKRATLR